jgi:hypothetical protein
MARGKHKVRATSQRSTHNDAILAQLRSELEMETTALSEAERVLEEVIRLRTDLAAENTALIEEVTPYAERLRAERDFLRSVYADAGAHHARVRESWSRYMSAAIDAAPGSTNLEQIESVQLTMGLGGFLDTGTHLKLKDRSTEAVTRLQRARGERRTVAAEFTPEQARAGRLTMALDLGLNGHPMIRPSLRQVLLDENIVVIGEDGLHQLRDPDELTEHQNRIRTEAIAVALVVWESRASSLNADAVHAWGSGNVIATTDEPGASRLALGFVPVAHDTEVFPVSAFQLATTLPLPSTPASSRNALARQSSDTALSEWRGVFESRRLVTERLGLPSHPFAPLAHHSQPSQGLAMQNVYSLSAFAGWLHDGPGSVYAHSAIGLTAAATYWLPAGQTASFAESEPMDESDRAEMILPFPQVFLAFAEPLVLEPVAATAETGEKWQMLSEIAHDAYRGNGAASAVAEDFYRRSNGNTWALPTIDDMLSGLGAHVEGILLLADSLGRPEDRFAWCLTIPGAYGSTLGRFVVPALRSATDYRDVVDNLTAVVAWAQWHEPDQSTTVPVGVSADDLEDYISTPDFQRNAKRAGAGIRVVDVRSTYRTTGSRPTRESESSDVNRTPHIRRGHWRRQRYGQGLEQSKRIRIAPVLVNAHRGDIAHRVYRLRPSTKVVAQ